jgi:hypothetical protein
MHPSVIRTRDARVWARLPAEGHIASVYCKLGVRARTELALQLAAAPAKRRDLPPSDLGSDTRSVVGKVNDGLMRTITEEET